MALKVLVIGITGMLGHKLYQVLNSSKEVEVFGTMRSHFSSYSQFNFFDKSNIFDNINSKNLEKYSEVIEKIKPDFVINCIGLIKQLKTEDVEMIYNNSLFPHEIAKIANSNNSKFIQVSTDCVFSGKIGNYSEEDIPDAKDLYGRSKLLGEVTTNNNLTIRTSIFGLELREKKSLMEWILSQKGNEIKGYKNAIFSGLSTLELSKILLKIILEMKDLSGLLNISVKPISKLELMKILNTIYDLRLKINSFDDFYCDRSLNNEKANKLGFGLNNISYEKMIKDLKGDLI